MENHTDLQGGKTGMNKKRKNNSEFWYIVKVYLVCQRYITVTQ